LPFTFRHEISLGVFNSVNPTINGYGWTRPQVVSIEKEVDRDEIFGLVLHIP
jgi:hypothetical protein